MAFPRAGGPSFQQEQPFVDAQFDIFDWHPMFQSCVRYFLDHAQYNGPVQALAAFINIQLPFQKPYNPVLSSRQSGSPPGGAAMGLGGPGMGTPLSRAAGKMPMGPHGAQPYCGITLLPYIRRLIATGFDFPAVMHGFFGDDWRAGVGTLHEQERRNYLFAAKSETWLKVKAAYDMGEDEMVPFLRPLQNVSETEIVGAESSWSEWLAMQDWMLGPRAPGRMGHGGVPVKREED
ncbi:hypothetical protein B0T22DRAFT_226444 [Podospora appendiculata]|uniref:Ilp is an apoptosis inhibitor n=1 Tax=Podospora appendiculata TaxID=314037 RepID=A0AAE0X5W0_9PEZI|nr:hypothetical protein B0T22DRAFT_226444 [Podospora appendiculata]